MVKVGQWYKLSVRKDSYVSKQHKKNNGKYIKVLQPPIHRLLLAQAEDGTVLPVYVDELIPLNPSEAYDVIEREHMRNSISKRDQWQMAIMWVFFALLYVFVFFYFIDKLKVGI